MRYPMISTPRRDGSVLVNTGRYCLALSWLLLILPAWVHAGVTVRLDSTRVTVGESFTIVYQIRGEQRVFPDFSGIEKHFEIIGRARQRLLSAINGRVEVVLSWKLELQARKAGRYVIPPIRFGNSKSPEITIEVRQGAASKKGRRADYFVEFETNTDSPYVQQQVELRLRIYYPSRYYIPTRNIQISAIRFLSGDAVVKDRGRAFPGKKRFGQRQYNVITQKYTLLPQKSGVLRIRPQTIIMLVPGKYVQGSFGFGSYRRYQRKYLYTRELVLKVRPKPAAYTGKYWLPTSKLELKEVWPQGIRQLRVGEPVTRQIKIIAHGLTAEQLPALDTGEIEGIKLYRDKAELNTSNQGDRLIGERSQKIAMIATKPGRYRLPEIRLDWWNINTGKMETARIPPRTLIVTAGTAANARSPDISVPPRRPGRGVETAVAAGPAAGIWFWSTLGFAILWVSTLLAWWYSFRVRGTRPRQAGHAKTRAPAAADVTEIRMACSANDPRRCSRALLAWAAEYWQDRAPTSLDGIARLLGDEGFSRSIAELNRCLYATRGTESRWNGTEFWKRFDQARRRAGPQQAPAGSALAPLHPQ